MPESLTVANQASIESTKGIFSMSIVGGCIGFDKNCNPGKVFMSYSVWDSEDNMINQSNRVIDWYDFDRLVHEGLIAKSHSQPVTLESILECLDKERSDFTEA